MRLMGYGGPLATLTLFFCQSSLDPLANVLPARVDVFRDASSILAKDEVTQKECGL